MFNLVTQFSSNFKEWIHSSFLVSFSFHPPNLEWVVILTFVAVDGHGKKTRGSVTEESRSLWFRGGLGGASSSKKTVQVLEQPERGQASFLTGVLPALV